MITFFRLLRSYISQTSCFAPTEGVGRSLRGEGELLFSESSAQQVCARTRGGDDALCSGRDEAYSGVRNLRCLREGRDTLVTGHRWCAPCKGSTSDASRGKGGSRESHRNRRLCLRGRLQVLGEWTGLS